MDIKIVTQWAILLFCSGLGILLLAFLWRMLCGSKTDPVSIQCAYRMWSEYNERHDKLSELNKANAELQNHIADLKRELEEVKGKQL